jgi:hypothetical protein
MPNTLTNLIPEVYSALDVVSRELAGFIPAVTRDPVTERAAVGQTVRSAVAPAASATDITPGVTPPDDGDQNIGNVSLTITKARRVPFRWNGEQSRGINNGGPGVATIQAQQIQQAIRTLVNEIEGDLAAVHVAASRAHGTAGTTPFAGGDLSDTAQLRKILADNGAPLGDLQFVMDTSAGANLRSKTQLSKANESADASLLRQGVLLDVHGFAMRESAQVKSFTAGSANLFTVSGAHAVGATSIAVATGATSGAASLAAGDIVTFAGDTNKYVVASALSLGASASGTLVIAGPGLRVAKAGGEAISVVGSSVRNMGFARSALVLASRLPALPDEGDMADDRTTVVDPRSGMAFELAVYRQYRQVQYEIAAAWGVKNIKPEHSAIMLG